MQMVPSDRHWIEAQPDRSDIQVIAGSAIDIDRSPQRPTRLHRPRRGRRDAWASTNPSVGRPARRSGCLHAVALRDVLGSDAVSDFTAAGGGTFGELTNCQSPWYRATRTFDRHRLAEINADLEGTTYRTVDPGWSMTTSLSAALRSPDALRAQLLIGGMLATPSEAFANPWTGGNDRGGRGRSAALPKTPRDTMISSPPPTAPHENPLRRWTFGAGLDRGEDDQATDHSHVVRLLTLLSHPRAAGPADEHPSRNARQLPSPIRAPSSANQQGEATCPPSATSVHPHHDLLGRRRPSQDQSPVRRRVQHVRTSTRRPWTDLPHPRHHPRLSTEAPLPETRSSTSRPTTGPSSHQPSATAESARRTKRTRPSADPPCRSTRPETRSS